MRCQLFLHVLYPILYLPGRLTLARFQFFFQYPESIKLSYKAGAPFSSENLRVEPIDSSSAFKVLWRKLPHIDVLRSVGWPPT